MTARQRRDRAREWYWRKSSGRRGAQLSETVQALVDDMARSRRGRMAWIEAPR